MGWIEILREEVARKGGAAVAKELGISRSAVSLACAEKYPASTKKIEDRVCRIYGKGGLVSCPILGGISPARCAENFRLARQIGMKAGSPQTLLLYKTCRERCPVRRP